MMRHGGEQAGARIYPFCSHKPPPRPHDPSDRIVIDTITAAGAGGRGSVFDTWEVRMFDPAGQFHCYFGARGLLHLQLWQPWFGVSILAPSRLTADQYEAFPVRGWKFAAPDFDAIVRAVTHERAVRTPARAAVEALCLAHVGAPATALARRSPAPCSPATVVAFSKPLQ